MGRKYELDIIQQAMDMKASGIATKAIARDLDVPRETVRYWFKTNGRTKQSVHQERLQSVQDDPAAYIGENRATYAYLLGVYLGDGYIAKFPCTYRLTIYQDSQYPESVEYYKKQLSLLFPLNKPGSAPHKHYQMIIVTLYSNLLPMLFPQHGPGRKHERKIELTDWQQKIVDEHPWEFIAGCIHTDGSRYINSITKKDGGSYEYPGYEFINTSKDILKLFMKSLDSLDIDYTYPGNHQVYIRKRKDVEILDQFVALKS